MIVEATLDANWRSSLTITPKEVDTFSSNCETLWIEKDGLVRQATRAVARPRVLL